jgi:hypothetical protein
MDSIYAAHEASVSKESRILRWLEYSNINYLSETAIHPDSPLAQWMHEVGFINIHIVKRALPIRPLADVFIEDVRGEFLDNSVTL